MYEITNNKSLKTKPTSQISGENYALNLAGLTCDHKALPIFSLLDFFEELLKDAKIRKQAIVNKIKMLSEFLANSSNSGVSASLRSIVLQNTEKLVNFLNDGAQLFNSAVAQLFCYAFGFRLEIYQHNENRLSVQYFGLKNNRIKRVLLSDSAYVMLKKTLSGLAKPEQSFSPKSINGRANSVRTAATKAIDEQNIMVKSELYESIDMFTHNSVAKNKSMESSLLHDDDSMRVSTLSPRKNIGAHDASKITSVPQSLPEFTFARRCANKSNGRLKFYNEAKEYGFIIMDDDTEVFVHKVNLANAAIDTCYLAHYNMHYNLLMQFNVQEYTSKNRKNRKAIDVVIVGMESIC